MEVKTNVMRLLDAAGISYQVYTYEIDENNLSGSHAADLIGIPPEQVFKTLVLQGASSAFFVCCIPVDSKIDLKKAARAAGEKSAALIPQKNLLPTTGYIRGGCSPIGMKKSFPTYIDETAELFDNIAVSAGARGIQIFLNPQDLASYISAEFVEVT